MVDTIKFSEMTDGGDIDNNKKVPGLKAGGNVLFNNPWTFLPPGTTAQRPTPSAEINYRLRFNTDEQLYEYYDAVLGAWTQLQESMFTQGPFVIYTADPSIPDGQNLGALANGILKQTITTGVATLNIAVNGTDYYGPGFVIPPADGGTGINNGTRTINLGSPTTGFVLTSDVSGNATWQSISGSGAITTIDGDTGSITPTLGVVTIAAAATGLSFTGSGSTLSLGGLLTPTFGGLGVSNPTAHGILVGEGASAVTPIVLGAGQILIGTTASDPVAGAIGSGTGILVGNSSGSITVSLASIASLNILSNITGGSAAPIANTLTATIDAAIGSTQGDILYRNATDWVVLPPGTLGQFLQTQGAAANPLWVTSATVTPAALTKVDDTNITLSLGGTPATALLQATSLTLGWTGQLAAPRGGTGIGTYVIGDVLYASATNALSALAGNITTTKQYLSQTGSGAASAAPVWATISGTDITGAALTKTDDTNVTMTLGGTPTTALLRAASMTLGWTGQLSLTRGGSNASLTASNGGIVYSTATAMAILSGTATAQQLLLSGANTTPQWSTTTYPLTNAINTIMYASSANVLGVITPVNNAVLISSAGGVPSMSTTLPSGLTIPGFAASGANADITSMSGLTGYLQAPLGIKDANGNIIEVYNSIPSAVNYIGITNAATTGFPAINSNGTDAAVPLNFQTKNSNFYFTDTTHTIAPAIRMYNAAATHFTGFKVSTAQATDLTLVMPAVDATVANQAWVSDAAGNTSFGAVVTSGTYTPTLTNGANVAASTPFLCQYMRVGSVVTVSGIFNLDITTTLTSTVLGISLPIASNFSDTLQAGGVALTGLSGDYGAILSNATNDNVQMQAVPVSTANVTYYFNFTYRIL